MVESSFDNETLHVVDYFNGTLKAKNEKIINDTFLQLVLNKSKIDISANKTTADKIRYLDKHINRENKEVKHTRFWMIFMRIVSVIIVVICIALILIATLGDVSNIKTILISVSSSLIPVGIIIFGLSWLVKKSYLKNKKELQEFQSERNKEFNNAQLQLFDLKNHIYPDLTFQIFEQTYPLISFARYFSESDYLNWANWLQDSVNSSVLYCLSGNLKTNPFIILKTKYTKMYDHIYTGSRTVMVRRVRYVNGRAESYMAAKVITATTTNPAPMYWTDTKLFFKSNAAESLSFINLDEFKNEKKAEKFFKKNKSMEPMDNPEFDRYFPCKRDNEVQFRTLFSPLAQEEMIKLMKTKNDYSFEKKETLNIVSSPSFENINFNINYNQFNQYYDYELIKNDFITSNQTFFSNIYFMFAPILVIPVYQQLTYRQPLFEKTKQHLMAFQQHEMIANSMYDINIFKHEQSVTDNILKTKKIFANSLYEINEIIAYGYRTKPRTIIVTVSDFEAGVVNVPVTVIDYFSVEKSTNVINSLVGKTTTQNNDLFQKNIEKYQSALNISAASWRGCFLSMIYNGSKTSINDASYKNFIKDLS